ncbi:MAG TPA: glycosyltransferase family 39 protein [Pyrinomonadaceae bacterium]|nr:glycosyltransferase family 39 protein [Pyrinomonadaceae bacterium]
MIKLRNAKLRIANFVRCHLKNSQFAIRNSQSSKRLWFFYALLLLIALGFRLFIALRLPNDEPDDGRVYSQIARNVLEQHVYSHDSQQPYAPSIIRLPGYPLVLAAVYAAFGHGNNTAVRVVQAVVDTATCVLIALVAFEWSIDDERKHRAAVIAFALAAVCPFTAIYVATILTEVWANFLAVALVLAATFAFKAPTRKKALAWWIVAGLIAGLAVEFRPDSGLFAAAVGATLVLSALARSMRLVLARVREVVPAGVLFSLAFCMVLVPWTIRNRRVFHVFQPLAPTHGEMPGEFVPHGYLLWLRTWLNDSRYIGPVLWSVDTRPIRITDFPASAFDSNEEKERVAGLLGKYNHPPDEEASSDTQAEDTSQPDEQASNDQDNDQGNDEENQNEEEEPEQEEQAEPEEANVEMTPDIDAGFAQIGQERRARAPLRYYIVLPLKRAMTLWFDTHSQYYPFNGELLPLKDLDYDIHQQYWLPLFAGLTALYSLLGVIGGFLLWLSRDHNARRWLPLAALLIFLRLGFFATLENPEPRYTVELFPFLIILAGAGASTLKAWAKATETAAAPTAE